MRRRNGSKLFGNKRGSYWSIIGSLGNPHLGLRCFGDLCVYMPAILQGAGGGIQGLDALTFDIHVTLACMLHTLEQ